MQGLDRLALQTHADSGQPGPCGKRVLPVKIKEAPHRAAASGAKPASGCMCSKAWIGEWRALWAGGHAKAAHTRQFQRWPPNIKSKDGTEEIDFEAFHPADGNPKIAPKRCVGASAGSG
jgi:hypothetical protein